MDIEIIKKGVILFVVLIFSLSFHEYAHAKVAYLLGDSTAYKQGRVSLNPLNHLDPMGTLFLLIIAFAGMGIGWAKPVPVDPYKLKHWERDSMLISIAGPLANLLLVVLVFVVYGCFFLATQAGFSLGETVSKIIYGFLFWGALCNISLFIFNMLPFVPLDGSKVYPFFLPKEIRKKVNKLLYDIGYWPLIIMLLSEYLIDGYGLFSLVFGPVRRGLVEFFPLVRAVLS
ncbi:MAG: site-2 protease family protein [Reichenbachiella sp.]